MAGLVTQSRLLTANPWGQFSWVEAAEKGLRQFDERELLAFLDADLRWRVEAGDIDVFIGASSADLRLADVLTITSDHVIDGSSRGFYAASRHSVRE